jgi:hypothetical protein
MLLLPARLCWISEAIWVAHKPLRRLAYPELGDAMEPLVSAVGSGAPSRRKGGAVMTLFNGVGVAVLAAPFVAITAVMVRESGWTVAAGVWLITLSIIGFLGVGIYMVMH